MKKETIDFNTSISEFRARQEKLASRLFYLPKDIIINEQDIEGIKCERIIPKGADTKKVVLYVHGGGYVSGSCRVHRGFVSKLALHTSVIHLVYNYRLAPEHPFPAALEDSLRIYQWLLSSGFIPQNIVMAGDSAGGGLCLAILLALKERKSAMPVAAVAISPWTDLTCSSDSYKTKNKLSAAPLNSWNVFSKYYSGDTLASLPFISPLFGDLQGLPSILINAGTDDELYEDGEKFYLKAKAAGVDIKFSAGIDMIHCYPVFAPMFKEASIALAEIVEFIKKQLKIT
jgi:acetyl esterase/lipase